MQGLDDYFVSKRDGWLVAVIWAGAAVALLALVPLLFSAGAHSLGERVLAVCGAVACAGVGLWILYGTGYAFASDHLLIRSGPFRWRVPYAEISRAQPSASPLSSPACSLDRLLIQYGRRRILVSPADRAGFVRRLGTLCPQLRLDGERLTAASRM